MRFAYSNYGVTDFVERFIKQEIFPAIDNRVIGLTDKIEMGDMAAQKEYDNLVENRLDIEKLIKARWFDGITEQKAKYFSKRYKIYNEMEDLIQIFVMKNLLGKDVSPYLNYGKDAERELNSLKKLDLGRIFLSKEKDLSTVSASDMKNLFSAILNNYMNMSAKKIQKLNRQEDISLDYSEDDERTEHLDPRTKTPQQEIEERESVCYAPNALNKMLRDLRTYAEKQIKKKDKVYNPILEEIYNVWEETIRKGKGGWSAILRNITNNRDLKKMIMESGLIGDERDIDKTIRRYNLELVTPMVKEFFEKEMDEYERECWAERLKKHMFASENSIKKYRYLVAKYVLGNEFKDPKEMAEEIAEESLKKVSMELMEIANLIS